uniref:CCHC-type domain-containing protein n=3 Tax=Chrysotila carterae TaxID=13221 RepID=A0A7S4BJY7_CHRCT
MSRKTMAEYGYYGDMDPAPSSSFNSIATTTADMQDYSELDQCFKMDVAQERDEAEETDAHAIAEKHDDLLAHFSEGEIFDLCANLAMKPHQDEAPPFHPETSQMAVGPPDYPLHPEPGSHERGHCESQLEGVEGILPMPWGHAPVSDGGAPDMVGSRPPAPNGVLAQRGVQSRGSPRARNGSPAARNGGRALKPSRPSGLVAQQRSVQMRKANSLPSFPESALSCPDSPLSKRRVRNDGQSQLKRRKSRECGAPLMLQRNFLDEDHGFEELEMEAFPPVPEIAPITAENPMPHPWLPQSCGGSGLHVDIGSLPTDVMMYQPGSTPGSAAGSNPGSPASTSRKNKLQRCSICGQLGHKSRTCDRASSPSPGGGPMRIRGPHRFLQQESSSACSPALMRMEMSRSQRTSSPSLPPSQRLLPRRTPAPGSVEAAKLFVRNTPSSFVSRGHGPSLDHQGFRSMPNSPLMSPRSAPDSPLLRHFSSASPRQSLAEAQRQSSAAVAAANAAANAASACIMARENIAQTNSAQGSPMALSRTGGFNGASSPVPAPVLASAAQGQGPIVARCMSPTRSEMNISPMHRPGVSSFTPRVSSLLVRAPSAASSTRPPYHRGSSPTRCCDGDISAQMGGAASANGSLKPVKARAVVVGSPLLSASSPARGASPMCLDGSQGCS